MAVKLPNQLCYIGQLPGTRCEARTAGARVAAGGEAPALTSGFVEGRGASGYPGCEVEKKSRTLEVVL